MTKGEPLEFSRASRALWAALAAGVMAAALTSVFWGVWTEKTFSSAVPIAEEYRRMGTDRERFWRGIIESDHRFTVWAIARNARTLATQPWRVFDAEPCYPIQNTLALGEHALSLGVLGVPFYVLGFEPIAIANLVILLLLALSGLAVYWLVTSWTGVPAAGVVAGLLFAFQSVRLRDVSHAYIYDNVWVVFALIFAQRWLTRGRWVDAIAASLFVALQLGSSFYAVVGAALFALPLGIWLCFHYGIRQIRPAQGAGVVAIVAVAALAIFGPYLSLQSEQTLGPRSVQILRTWAQLLPPATTSSGWLCMALACLGLALGWRRIFGRMADVRWALLAGALLVAATATGHFFLAGVFESRPNLFALLRAVIPGLDAVRAPGNIASGMHLALCLLAGLGAASLVRWSPRRAAPWIAAALVVLAYADVVRPAFLPLEPRVRYRLVHIAPRGEQVRLFEKLAQMGNEGPLLELPVTMDSPSWKHWLSSRETLLSAYHGRRTSACYNSFTPARVQAVWVLAEQLPDRGAVEALRDKGFSTIIVHHPKHSEAWATIGAPLQELANESDPPVRWLVSVPYHTAFEILPAGDTL